jgi:putative serine protease PepD
MAAPPAPKPNRFARVAALGAAALVLMAGSGVAGGLIGGSLANNGNPATTVNKTFTAAPSVDRASLADIVAKVQPSVVDIDTGSGEGSGVVLTSDGYILTNNHVVATARGNTMNVTFTNGKTAKATVVGTDPKTDLAVIKAQGVSGLTAATFGDSDAMRIGDSVLALGSPLGLQGSVTEGIISATNRTIQVGDEQRSPSQQQSGVTSIAGALQTDAAINPGNSGGPLVNLSGEVIGINTAIATSGSSNGNIGVGFAIPSNRAKQVADQLMKGEKVSHAYLGVSVADADGNAGAVVQDVPSDGPAAKAGIQKGDVITKVGDKTIRGSEDLVSAVQSNKAGEQITITYTRNGAEKTATVTLGEAS